MQAHFPSTTPTKFEPQYAEFDVSKKGGEDALPRMPSWETAESKKVMVEGEEVEMSNLKKSPAHTQNNIRMNSPSPSPVGLMSMSHNRSDANLLGSSGEPWSNHSQQALLPNSLSPNYVQSNQGPYVAPTHGNNDKFGTNHQSAGFGLDDPYDDHNAVSGTNGYGHAGQQTPYGAPVYQPHDNVSYGVVGAAGSAGAMPLRNQSARPHHQPYGAPPPIGADMGLGGRRSPALAQGRSPYHQEQVRDQLAEMPAMPHEQGATREMAGSTPPEGYGLRRPPTGDNNGSSPRGGRPPYGMDSRAGNSPGLRQSPAPRGGHPHGHSPRGSPAARQDQGFGRPPPSPRDNVNRSYSPAPARQFTPVTERQYSPAPDRQRTPKPRPLAQPVQPPSNFFGQSPPHSPITNNAGFDFTSGYSRPQEYEDHVPLAQSPTTAAYPGQKTYQPR
ncbi:hypothetical protein NOR_07269 [Metarhizium rileyi]|uniref:Uncharacterized protein n=1 Tax=Metarhizium rileyi (strain RCEF 4871) TaxID=1649241 RepID=A0A166YU00_METRR|nr:hypothetical protein NOR_07269 [Metarhizium rileyi RCEF 4871]